jgi:uncharacterized cupredoxin-like copper-binding protein
MKRYAFATWVFALGLAAMPSQGEERKSLGEKTGELLDKTAEKTKDAGRAVVDTSKRAVESAKDAVTPDADARKVDVRLIEHEIEMPKQLPAGKTAFVVKNAGKAKHNFEIQGQGLDKKFWMSVDPAESKTLHVDLKPGTYKVFCPVGDHEEHGMKLELKVE